MLAMDIIRPESELNSTVLRMNGIEECCELSYRFRSDSDSLYYSDEELPLPQ